MRLRAHLRARARADTFCALQPCQARNQNEGALPCRPLAMALALALWPQISMGPACARPQLHGQMGPAPGIAPQAGKLTAAAPALKAPRTSRTYRRGCPEPRAERHVRHRCQLRGPNPRGDRRAGWLWSAPPATGQGRLSGHGDSRGAFTHGQCCAHV